MGTGGFFSLRIRTAAMTTPPTAAIRKRTSAATSIFPPWTNRVSRSAPGKGVGHQSLHGPYGFGFGSFALEAGDAFHAVGLREHVDGPGGNDAVARVDEDAEVAGQRGGSAADVDDSPRSEPHDPLADLARPGPTRVEQHAVVATALAPEPIDRAPGVGPHHADSFSPGAGGDRLAGQRRGDRIALDRHHSCSPRGDGEAEVARSGEELENLHPG